MVSANRKTRAANRTQTTMAVLASAVHCISTFKDKVNILSTILTSLEFNINKFRSPTWIIKVTQTDRFKRRSLKWPWMPHLTNSPVGISWSQKQAAGWKSALSERPGRSCPALWMYKLYPQPGEGTIRRLLPRRFLWPWGCGAVTHSKTSHSPCWPPPPLTAASTSKWWWRAAPLVMLWIFIGCLFHLAKKTRASERVVRLRRWSLLGDSWQEVVKGCQSFLIWIVLIRLCTLGLDKVWQPVKSVWRTSDRMSLR